MKMLQRGEKVQGVRGIGICPRSGNTIAAEEHDIPFYGEPFSNEAFAEFHHCPEARCPAVIEVMTFTKANAGRT